MERMRYRIYTRHLTSSTEKHIALITGSTSGIGLGIAYALASRGCDIILNGFVDDTVLKGLQEELTIKYHCTNTYINADLSNLEDVKKLKNGIFKLYPNGIDILVNNAGFQHVSPVEDFDMDKWQGMISVMLTTPFYLIQSFLPAMKRKGWGRIINIASVHGLRASPFKSGYCSAKHGILGLTKVVALETAGTGVTCNSICPGYVNTPILQGQVRALAEKEGLTYERAEDSFLSRFHPSGKPVGISELAEMAVFLCSDSASQMTGAPIIMDGGWTSK